MNEQGTCLLCGKAGVIKWTLHVDSTVAIADLCAEHSAPLQQVVDASQAAQATKPGGRKEKPVRLKPGHQPSFRPLDWTPPDS